MNLVAEQPGAVAVDAFILTYGADRGAKGRFPLPRGQTVTIGRALDADLRLPDGLTSRRHAEITVVDGQVIIEDLESANGTFINGCRVRRALLRPGDRMLIGVTSLELSVEYAGTSPAAPAFQTRPLASARAAESETGVVSAGRVIAGSVKEISLNDLLQLLANTRKSGVLSVRNNRATARIYLVDGRITNVTLDGNLVENPQRLLFRVLRWRAGLFELHPGDAKATPEAITDCTESLLLSAAQQHDEMIELETVLPSLDAALEVPETLPGDLSALKESEVNALQLFIETPSLGSVVERIANSDIEAYRLVAGLLRAGYLVPRE
jgi:pSer/pThr/pTyr-binding forkhead associated (FHA) protein